MSDRPVRLLLDDISEAITKIESYLHGVDEQAFMSDSRTVDAVVRNLEVIGEAANRLPDDLRGRKGEVDWRGVVGLRNRVIHGYFDVDLSLVWAILQSDLPQLRDAIDDLRDDSI